MQHLAAVLAGTIPIYAPILVGKLCPDHMMCVGLLFQEGCSLRHVAKHWPERGPRHRAVRSDTLCGCDKFIKESDQI
jgi:hypothetical protein